MKFHVLAVLLSLQLAGCGDIYITSTTVVKTKESPAQRAFPRGEFIFACTTMAGLYDYLDNNRIAAGCGQVEMSAVTERGSYDSFKQGRVGIYQFMRFGYTYFTYYQGWGRRYY